MTAKNMEVNTLNNLEKVLLMILSEYKLGLKIHVITKIFREKHGIEINPNEIRNIVFEPEIGLKNKGLVEHNKVDFLYRLSESAKKMIAANPNNFNSLYHKIIKKLNSIALKREAIKLNLTPKKKKEFLEFDSGMMEGINLVLDEMSKNNNLVQFTKENANKQLLEHLHQLPKWIRLLEIDDLVRSENNSKEKIMPPVIESHKSINTDNNILAIRRKLEKIWEDGFFSDSEWTEFLKFKNECQIDNSIIREILDEFKITNQNGFNYQKMLNFHFDFQNKVEFMDASKLLIDRYGVVLPKIIFETHKLTFFENITSHIQKSDITIRLNHSTYLVDFSKHMTEYNHEFDLLQLDKNYLKIYIPHSMTNDLRLAAFLIIDAITYDLIDCDEKNNIDLYKFKSTRATVRRRLGQIINDELVKKFN
jgi:hypothetical protein